VILSTRIVCFNEVISIDSARNIINTTIKTLLKKILPPTPQISDKNRRLITSLFSGNRFQASLMLIVIFSLILTKGVSSDSQAPIFSSVVNKYVEETSASIFKSVSRNSKNSPDSGFFAISTQEYGQGGPGSSTEPSPIREDSVIAYNPADTNYIDSTSSKRNQIAEYEVQAGDTISFIASDYGVSINSILWANNLKNAENLTIGQILKIPPITGVIHGIKKGDTIQTIAKKYGADADKIIEFNALPKDGVLQVGKQIVVPDGKIGSAAVIANAQQSTAKRFSYLPDMGDFFRWPAAGFNWGIIHGRNGVDIANSCGTPIYAAAEGTVTTVDTTGWNGGFGKYMKIQHTNGTETLYAHTTKILVNNGEYVSKGEEIALMGTTGHSTGCHLHFEVHGAKNPMAR